MAAVVLVALNRAEVPLTGDRRTGLYHNPYCAEIETIKPEDRIEFNGLAQAEGQKFKRCQCVTDTIKLG